MGRRSLLWRGSRTAKVQAIALDATKAEKELGWKPKVDPVEGIQRTIQWLRATRRPEPAAITDA
jgi:UDP-glucose 4-epimerase